MRGFLWDSGNARSYYRPLKVKLSDAVPGRPASLGSCRAGRATLNLADTVPYAKGTPR